jgi:inner membrane protein
MNVVTHALLGWSVAAAVPSLSRGDRAWVVVAAVASDLDGLGIVVELATRSADQPLTWWSEYHHVLAHDLPFAVLLAAAAWLATRKAIAALLVVVAVHLHLVADLVGSRGPDGYQWPIPYLWPFSDSPALTVPWQWQLNAWPNVVFGVALLAWTFWFAWRSGSSPLELVSPRANRAFVRTLRSRFSSP